MNTYCVLFHDEENGTYGGVLCSQNNKDIILSNATSAELSYCVLDVEKVFSKYDSDTDSMIVEWSE